MVSRPAASRSLAPVLIATLLAWGHTPADTPASTPRTLTVSAVNLPPGGKVLLFIGQDSDTIGEYLRGVPEDPVEGITLYTHLKSGTPAETLQGMSEAADWNSGTTDFQSTLAQTPGAAIAIGLAIDACKQPDHPGNIEAGQYDASISKLAQNLASMHPRPVFLRIGYEFDGPWNCYSPNSYIKAFRRIVQGIRAHGKTEHVAMVWQSATWPDPAIAGDRMALYDHRRDDHLDRWYPGDEYVDWIALSVFYRDLSQWSHTPVDTPQAAQEKLLAFARRQGKPVMIAEAAPQAYRIGTLTHSYIDWNHQTARTAQQIWNDWFQKFFAFIHDNRDVIRAVAYINTHWESQALWHCAPEARAAEAGCPQGNWGDSRIQANALIKRWWLNEVSRSDTWYQLP